MKPLKHNKLRNTGLIFEILVRKMTNDVFSDVNESTNYKLIKKYFNKDTQLSKELQLYKLLSETKETNESKINYIVDSSIKVKKELDDKQLIKEKYALISEIKTLYNGKLNEFFNCKVDKYKNYASIYKILEHNMSENVEDFLESRFYIVESFQKPKIEKDSYINEDMMEAINIFNKQDKDTQTLMFKTVVSNFNREAKKILIPEQIEFLQSYTFKDNSNSNFSKTFKKTIQDSNNILNEAINTIDDDVTKVKLGEMKRMLKIINDKKILKESHIITVMKYIKLSKELKNLINATKVNNKLIGKQK